MAFTNMQDMEKNDSSHSRIEDVRVKFSEDHGIPSTNLEAEASLRKKFDKRVLPLTILIYLMAFIDRTNMGNARILGMQEDLKLVGYRFNIALTAFFVTYVLFEM